MPFHRIAWRRPSCISEPPQRSRVEETETENVLAVPAQNRNRRPQPRPRVLTGEQIEALASFVGEKNVSADPVEPSKMAPTTLPDGTTPAGILWASCREQVQAVVGWAAANEFPIYPISTGKNWGYGDVCAPVAGYLLLDLSRMNRIPRSSDLLRPRQLRRDGAGA